MSFTIDFFDMMQIRSASYLAAVITILGLSACASFQPVPLEELSFRERAETEEQDGLRISASVLSREEARQAFGVNLEKRNIQPVWLEIENRTDKNFWFMLSGLDPNYFSAHEAAYMNHYRFGGQTNKQMDDYFSDVGIDQLIRTGEINSGFAFTNEKIGAKETRVRLYGSKDVRTFTFFLSVPGVESEWDRKDLALIAEQVEVETETDEELREALRALPCCTQRSDGSGQGDPLNLVLIGDVHILKAFITAGWDETVFEQDLRSFLSADYLYGRPPDIQFQKSRRRVNSVNLVRLWISPMRYKDKLVVVGTVERNIDPNVDEAVQYVLEDLATAEMVERYGLIDGVGAVSRENPRQDFLRSPYWTDGKRAVLEIARQPVELENIRFFSWDWSFRFRPINDE
jgi:hypothetical protein